MQRRDQREWIAWTKPANRRIFSSLILVLNVVGELLLLVVQTTLDVVDVALWRRVSCCA
jgi:hypothetical protein